MTAGGLIVAAMWLCGCNEANPTDNAEGSGGTSYPNDDAGNGGPNSDDGGPGSGDGDGSPIGPALDNAYYPFVSGSKWIYTHSGELTVWNENVALDSVVYEGKMAMLLKDTPGPSGSHTRSYLAQDGTAIRRVHKEILVNGSNTSLVDYDPGFTRFDEAWAQLPIGTTMTLSYERTEMLVNGTVTVEMRYQQYTVESTDAEVSVPAGSFSGCVVIFRSRQAADGSAPVGTDIRDKRFWFCPGVGKVREENLTDGGIEVLKWCSIPGGRC